MINLFTTANFRADNSFSFAILIECSLFLVSISLLFTFTMMFVINKVVVLTLFRILEQILHLSNTNIKRSLIWNLHYFVNFPIIATFLVITCFGYMSPHIVLLAA